MLYGWTEYDLAKLELQLRETRLNKMAMTPKRLRRPIRVALAGALTYLADHLATEPHQAPSAGTLVSGGIEG